MAYKDDLKTWLKLTKNEVKLIRADLINSQKKISFYSQEAAYNKQKLKDSLVGIAQAKKQLSK